MANSILSRRAFVVAATLVGAGFASRALADEPEMSELQTAPASQADAAELTLYREWLVDAGPCSTYAVDRGKRPCLGQRWLQPLHGASDDRG
jgi:hypothetical protein